MPEGNDRAKRVISLPATVQRRNRPHIWGCLTLHFFVFKIPKRTIYLKGGKQMKRLKFQKSKCIGCLLCAQACSAVHEGEYAPAKARINIETYYDKGELKYHDSFCILCKICMKKCPIDAISMVDDHIVVDMDACTGCGICKDACPKKVVQIREEKAYICDTCEGKPYCVQICPQNALTFE